MNNKEKIYHRIEFVGHQEIDLYLFSRNQIECFALVQYKDCLFAAAVYDIQVTAKSGISGISNAIMQYETTSIYL